MFILTIAGNNLCVEVCDCRLKIVFQNFQFFFYSSVSFSILNQYFHTQHLTDDQNNIKDIKAP